ncbi:hypothetical protein CERSUDRAFT_75403 [Gelatoporia subvermispora B]|uniref:DNA 3'-5' helicase n=1 Tax=Ceriporiopsis subvermispora (strain B) TaxID=914234 RepID=M2QSU0_CERS8|nr:hypothetical protein CERSUDRAFT_75403 [Gelatoporia subvermispora B]
MGLTRSHPFHSHMWKPRLEHAAHTCPIISQEELERLACCMCLAYGWGSNPRPFQMDSIKAQLEGSDAIIQAATGSGKTAIAAGPHLWDGVQGRITIMVCPLLALEEEMVNTVRDEFGISAVALNSINGACSPHVVSRILSGQYQVVLVSPEMLQSRTFINRFLCNSQFTHHVFSVIVDEAHCVSHWGANFCKKLVNILRTAIVTSTSSFPNTSKMLEMYLKSLASAGLIRPFNAALSQDYRQEAMAAFRRNPEPGLEKPVIRILVCTDAAGMGCNVPDVDLVVRWKIPVTLSNWIYISPLAVQLPIDTDAPDEGLLAFVQITLCRRQVWRTVFESQEEVQCALEAWCDKVWNNQHGHSHYDSTAILDNSTIDLLSSIGAVSREVCANLLQDSWIWWNQYSEQLLGLLKSLQHRFISRENTKGKRRATGAVASQSKADLAPMTKHIRGENTDRAASYASGSRQPQFVPWVPPIAPPASPFGHIASPAYAVNIGHLPAWVYEPVHAPPNTPFVNDI